MSSAKFKRRFVSICEDTICFDISYATALKEPIHRRESNDSGLRRQVLVLGCPKMPSTVVNGPFSRKARPLSFSAMCYRFKIVVFKRKGLSYFQVFRGSLGYVLWVEEMADTDTSQQICRRLSLYMALLRTWHKNKSRRITFHLLFFSHALIASRRGIAKYESGLFLPAVTSQNLCSL